MIKQPLLNTYVNNAQMQDVLSEIEYMARDGKKHYVTPVNVDVIVKIEKDPYLKEIIDQADIVPVDGKPLIWISRWLHHPIKWKISGSDLVPLLCDLASERGYSIFILGGKDGVAEQAAKNLINKHENLHIVGTYAPPIGFENDMAELCKMNEMIANAHPDFLFACFGCPKQEKWVYENYQKYGAGVTICAGATVDFLAGNVKRAPRWMSDHGFEWFYRFLQEPKRMFKRYFVDDMKILKLAWKYRCKK